MRDQHGWVIHRPNHGRLRERRRGPWRRPPAADANRIRQSFEERREIDAASGEIPVAGQTRIERDRRQTVVSLHVPCGALDEKRVAALAFSRLIRAVERLLRQGERAVGAMGAQLLTSRRDQGRGVHGSGRVEIESHGHRAAHRMTLAPRGRELRGEHHLLQGHVERRIRRLEHHQSERLDLAKTIDRGVYDCMARHAAAP